MKPHATHLSILAFSITWMALHPIVTCGGVIFVEEPQPIDLTMGAAVGVDLNREGLSELWIRYYGMPVCMGAPEGSSNACSLGVTLEFAPTLHLLGSPGSLDPIVLLPGQTVGPTSTEGVWLETFRSPISLIFQFGDVAWVRHGYPDYTAGLDRLAIGFRLGEGESFYYGFFDVSLATWMPHIEGIVLADEPNVSLSVIQVPEPGILILAIMAGATLWFRSRRHTG